jgi:NAD(P)H-hydrate epimerase
MIEVDRAMMDDYRIELIQMLENAGRNLAHLARVRFLDGNPSGKHVVILAGTGGNGGGALVCSRRQHTWGARVQVVVSHPAEDFTPVPAHQLDILRRMQVSLVLAEAARQVGSIALIIDGLIGYSLKEAPRGTASDLIRWANTQLAPILALDVPSGVDTTTGTIFDPAIKATATMTLALPKAGLRAKVLRRRWVNSTWPISASLHPSTRSRPWPFRWGFSLPRASFSACARDVD